jgi:hypothetical protein
MTKNEALRRARLDSYLLTLGFTDSEVASLRRINSTLQRWHELECGTDRGHIERDDETGKPFWGCPYSGRRSTVPDRETGALRRLAGIISARNERMPALSVVMLPDRAAPNVLTTYIQSDPRGAALYILRPGDIPAGTSVESCYTRGVCVF